MNDLSTDSAHAVLDVQADQEAKAPAAQPEAEMDHWEVLVVTRALALTRLLANGLRSRGITVRRAVDDNAAWAALRRGPWDGMVLDLDGGPNLDCIGFMRHIRQNDATMPLVAIATPNAGNGDLIAEAISVGALVLAPPVAPQAVLAALDTLRDQQRHVAFLAYARQNQARQAGLAWLVGESNPMLHLKTRLRMLLDEEALHGGAPALLLRGPTGSGKREVARALHFDGLRRAGPFVSLNGADLLASDAEARLLGLDAVGGAGAGAGASASAKGWRVQGLVAAANGGTLFISELAAMPLALQSRFVALLKQGKFQLAGAARKPGVTVRLIAATKHRPEELLQASRLLPALLALMDGAALELPPLCQRGADIKLLAHRFVEQAAQRQGMHTPALSGAALDCLASHPWPGNLRELRRVLEQALLMQQQQQHGAIEPSHLPLALHATPVLETLPTAASGDGLHLRQLEREALRAALLRSGGNVSKAARLLGTSRDALRSPISRYGLNGFGRQR
jgi:two-component system, NtrC family, response regulator AtoC